jgi:hypothetical protein
MASKYRNKIVILDGKRFMSRAEAGRYVELRQMELRGEIKDLRLQVPYRLKYCKYIADFVYVEGGKLVVEDVKGVKTAMYNLKKKMMREEHSIEIKEHRMHATSAAMLIQAAINQGIK